MKYLFYFILIHLIIAAPQLNIYYTDENTENENDENITIQYHCFRLAEYLSEKNDLQLMSFCMNELPSKFHIVNNDLFQKFNFTELSQRNITSYQLYLWSAPIDIIERYQLYLNHLLTSNNSLITTEIFYNCTLPRFGPQCQYELPYHHPLHSSLYEIIHSFYTQYRYNPTTLTCYTHLECNRGPSPACLDWSEICDGKIDCLGDGADEEYCWQLEINECKSDEYRCRNGQCIPKSFYRDQHNVGDCTDSSDEFTEKVGERRGNIIENEIPFIYEDTACQYSPFTSSCHLQRSIILMDTIRSIKDSSVSNECWPALRCLISCQNTEYSLSNKYCEQNTCEDIVKNHCPNITYFPNVPVLFDDIYLTFIKNHSQDLINSFHILFFICYKKLDYNNFFTDNPRIQLNNLTCIYYKQFSSLLQPMFVFLPSREYHRIITKLYEIVKPYYLSFNYNSTICDRSSMYQCLRSTKCISIHRLLDTINDCPHMDDENETAINNINLIERLKQKFFRCRSTNKDIHLSLVGNGQCDCGTDKAGFCEDEMSDLRIILTRISFPTLCDGFTGLAPILIDGQNETDETECPQWECNNIYTRCDSSWNCPDGRDEIGCTSYPTLNCSSDHHYCISPHTNQLMCLPTEKSNDGHVDCVGATDEQTVCLDDLEFYYASNFYCMNQSSQSCVSYNAICDGKKQCEHGDDEKFCTKFYEELGICLDKTNQKISDAETFICAELGLKQKKRIKYFTLTPANLPTQSILEMIQNMFYSNGSTIKLSKDHKPRCHRGLDLRIWLNNTNNSSINTCLCPSNYYGSQCQYQNQRISLTIKFRALSDSLQTVFAIIISLIDDSDQRLIHSYEQITYLSTRDCKTKFKLYLLYSTRPKDPTKNYSIHIDIYERISLNYLSSLLLPVHFPFLPVHKLAFIVDITRNNNTLASYSDNQCIHGKWIKYSNQPENNKFCHCEERWSGKYCNIQRHCECSSDSLCIGVTANNRSICICRLNKFGSKCLLTNPNCQTDTNSTCQNGGQCVPNDYYLIPKQSFTCLCPKGFNGNRCQFTDNKLNISFERSITPSQSIFIHFIEVIDEGLPVRATTFKTIPLQQDSIIISWSQPFHIVFIEFLNKTYYLMMMQNFYNPSTTIERRINPSDRCPNISELFNETFVQLYFLRRMKYYHLPCQKQSLNLSCFHDDIQLCLCYDHGEKRLANCFNFDHNMTFDCSGGSECENGAQCIQDRPDCPKKSMCICPMCFYGERCQFSTNGFGLSLEAILGYHIYPYLTLIQQPSIVQFTLALTIIFIIIGLINGIFSLITFKNKIICEVGCGLYLFGSSISTLLTMIIFGLKFFILLLSQMRIISNRSFLLGQCYSIDFILRICLCMDQWLNGCVAVERAFTTIKGALFDKRKSKQTAKFVIFSLFIIIVGTSIHDPIYRQLIDEENDDDNVKRTWCIVSYSSRLQTYNSAMNIFQFFGPFLLNLISSIILITQKSRQEVTINFQLTYQEILLKQIRQHKHLLTAPIVLVILAVPRLIITFISKCMKSMNDSWLFLCGYFISFIPPMLTFVVFILPSKFYKKVFRKTMKQWRGMVRQRFYTVL